jgi:S1/P1 Nuclease
MKSRLFLSAAAVAIALAPTPAFAWGKTGHRVVAKIADAQLSGLARAHVRALLGRAESLDEAANWPDEMKSHPSPFWQKTASPWHYVTLNGVLYDHAPSEGDALEALNRFSAMLRDPHASLQDKQLALRFIVHLVGDLHQPLHVGKCCDRGGNEVKVKWFGRDLNLHSVWDSALVDEQQLSFTEYSAKLQRHTNNEDVIAWWDINPRDWISESAQIRETVYPRLPPKGAKGKKGQPAVPELSWSYVYEFTPVMERRLSQAGVRLAAYLNAIYASPQPLPAERPR